VNELSLVVLTLNPRFCVIAFADNQNAHLLTPAFAHGLIPSSDAVSVSDLEALLLESEADIRAADRDLREIAELESRGVLDAGKLPSK
jgi:hypothetical protein